MALYTERVQTVLTKEQRRLLAEIADEKKMPLSVLIREAVERVYFEEGKREQRRQALKRLLALEAPVSDWTEIEQEIIDGAQE